MTGAARVTERLDELYARCGPTRPGYSHEEDAAHELAAAWMGEAGLVVGRDEAGNLFGRRGAARIWSGSHLDSVPNGGRFDGVLGVVAAIEAAERLPEAELAVVAFRAEETGPMGSRRISELPEAFVELHIEQGAVLERLGEPLGVVTAINGQSHATVAFTGEAGHAGTVPLEGRKDALAAAAEWVLAVEGVGTVGQVAVEPGARNVIPGRATLSLDVRRPDDGERHAAFEQLKRRAHEIAAARDLELTWGESHHPAVKMDEYLGGLWGVDVRLPSGAGHDAAMLASIVPATMLFVRCRGGISHNPAEHVEPADANAGARVLLRLIENFRPGEEGGTA